MLFFQRFGVIDPSSPSVLSRPPPSLEDSETAAGLWPLGRPVHSETAGPLDVSQCRWNTKLGQNGIERNIWYEYAYEYYYYEYYMNLTYNMDLFHYNGINDINII